ncbi:uncharacterized protein LOC114165381 [Vigna unguiculata]|uniref:uncharacterized protein LOC114165381 n=1 Tax=Vigna unguiculata TaxID=3917 RepID=UPI001016B55B|nr:uncharacterized protein LOC114165381 [Vigna unguiculata]
MAVEEWVKQKQFYNHTDNSCVANHKCGVYTQVVWRKSMELECAQVTCVKAIAKPATTSTRSVILKPANQKTKSVNIVATPADSQTTIDNRCCGREHLHCAAEPPLTQWLRFTVETR